MAVFLKIILHLRIFFYQLTIYAYYWGIQLASLWNGKARQWSTGRKVFPVLKNTTPSIWMHCASLGEFEQGRPILEQIKKKYPQYPIVVSFFSPSGYEVRKNYTEANQVIYLPIDTPKNAKKLIAQINPRIVLWIKNEFWHFYLSELKKKNIPVLLIAAKFNRHQPFFKWYGSFWRSVLNNFQHIFVQNQESLQLLSGINYQKNISISGDPRFDRVFKITQDCQSVEGIKKFINEQICLVAGSTWQEDERLLQSYFSLQKDIKLIIAPHEIHAANLQRILKDFDQSILYSDWIKNHQTNDFKVLIIDNIGMLAQLYQYAAVAYVGGAFRKKGLHNILEPIAYGIPVVFGPNYQSFPEAVESINKNAAISISTAHNLFEILTALLAIDTRKNEMGANALQYLTENKGATQKIMHYIAENRLLTN